MTLEGLTMPEPRPTQLDRATSAVLALDLTARCNDPKEICHELMERLGAFLERVRGARVPVVFTASLQTKGTPEGAIASALKQRADEAVLHPDAFDKFYGGELQACLTAHNVKDLVVTGSATNVAVMYTATAAARVFRYNVIIPLDGVNSRNPIEHDYAIHQLTAVPAQASRLITFSTLGQITFK